MHRCNWQDVRPAFNILGGDLEGVEKKAGTAGVEMRGAEGIENLGEGDLDGAAIFEDGELERFVRGEGRPCGEDMQAGVEVAIRFIAERRCRAFGSVGHDMATFVAHFWWSPSPTRFL